MGITLDLMITLKIIMDFKTNNMKKVKTQQEQIQKHLESGKKITAVMAYEKFGCLRLASRIFNLKKAGLPIITEMVTKNGSTFASYQLVKK
jgi:hypothetical protein